MLSRRDCVVAGLSAMGAGLLGARAAAARWAQIVKTTGFTATE